MKRRYEDGIASESAVVIRQSIASELKNVRLSHGLTQQALADRAGTQKSNISRMESGKYNPSIDFLAKLASSLGVKLDVHLE